MSLSNKSSAAAASTALRTLIGMASNETSLASGRQTTERFLELLVLDLYS
jgi:hypothetical protein